MTCSKCQKEHAELVEGVCPDCRDAAQKASAAAAELARQKHAKEAEAAASGVPGEVTRLVADVERGLRADLQKLRAERAATNTPASPPSTGKAEGGGGLALAVVLGLVVLGLAIFAGWKKRQEAQPHA